MSKCVYYLNGVKSELYTELYGYLDNTSPEKRTTNSIYKILKQFQLATVVGEEIFVTQGKDVLPKLIEINRINRKYPGLLQTQFIRKTPKTPFSPENELHSLIINESVLNEIPKEEDNNADFRYKTQYDIDTYVRTVGGINSAFQKDYLLDEQARRENESDQSRQSDMEREKMDMVEQKVTHLKEAFAAAMIEVEVIYDEDLAVLGQVDSKIPGEPVVIRINPNLVREDTVYHEFGHIYVDMLGVNNPVIAQAIEELRGTPLYEEVKALYPDLKGERLDKEVLVTAIGREGAKITRKNPSRLQILINRILRAFSNMLNKLGIKATPNTAAIIAEEMFAKNLRTTDMIRPISAYTQESREEIKLKELADKVRTNIRSKINRAKKLPTKEREKELPVLEATAATLEGKIRKVENFVYFVNHTANQIALARQKYDHLMSLSVEERAKSENLKEIMAIKQLLDGTEIISSIKSLLRAKKDKVAKQDVVIHTTMSDRIIEIIEEKESLEDNFLEDGLPVMAEILLEHHNENIDIEIQKIIDNAEEHKRTPGLETNVQEYKKLKSLRDRDVITEEEFRDKKVKLFIEQLKNKQLPNRGALIRILKNAHKDKSAFSYWFDPIIYSSDPAIQLFVKSVKQAVMKSNDMTLDFKYDLKEEYDEFSQGKSDLDIENLNNDLLEEVTTYVYDQDEGIRKPVKVLSLVQPYLIDKMEKDQQEMYLRLAKKYDKPLRKDYKTKEEYQEELNKWSKNKTRIARYNSEVDQWVKENTEPVEGWREELSKINKEIALALRLSKNDKLTAEQQASQGDKLRYLNKLKRRNLTPNGTPRNDWSRPKKSKYRNPKYDKIQSSPKLKKYYDFILEEYKKGQRMVGVNKLKKNSWDDFSYIMPSVRKEFIDRAKEQGMKTAAKDLLKDTFTITETDDEFGRYDDESGELVQNVPVYYTNTVESKDISRDIASSIYRFRHMAHNFQTKNEIVGQVDLFRMLLKERPTLEVNAAGVEMISKIAEQLGIKLPKHKDGESYNYKHIEEWINMIMYGQHELKQQIPVGGKTVSATKTAGAITSFTGINMLAGNILQGANQFILDNTALLTEGVAGQFINKSDLAWAKTKFWSEGAGVRDLGKFAPETKMGKAMELFDALTEFTDNEGKRLVGSMVRRGFSKDNLMFIQQGVEYELSATRMLALMRNLKGKLKDKDGNIIMNEEGQPADLYDLLVIDKKGKMSVDSRVANFKKSDFINLLQGLARRTNQVKGSFDSNMLQRRWYGKLIMLFRNWAVPGIRKRYGHGGLTGSTLHMDEELGTVTQGMYVSFWNMLSESIEKKITPWAVYGVMTEMEQQNVKRTMVELSSLVGAMALIAALSNIDDEDETWVSNFALYQAKRYRMEVLQWTPVFGTGEALRIAKSPTATAKPLEQGLALMEHLVFREIPYMIGLPIDDKKLFYQRKSGRFEKGDRKLRKMVEDLIPVLRGINKSKTPKEAAQWFDSIK